MGDVETVLVVVFLVVAILYLARRLAIDGPLPGRRHRRLNRHRPSFFGGV